MRWVYLFFLILLALSTWIHTVNAAVVAVPDRVLGGVLRSKLNLAVDADITDTALRNLDELILAIPTETDFKIADLTGLEYATRLTRVILDGHSISNLEPLTSWTAITALSLTGNSIVDLEPLRNLTTLTTLHLSNNQIADVSPLAGLTNLVDLALAGNDGIVDTSPLAWLPLTTSVDVDIPPAVRINDVPTSEQSGAFNVTIEFSEVVTGFQQVDIALTGSANATVTSFSGSNKEYTATITPKSDGEVVIQVPAGVAVAQDNNSENNIASSEYTVSVDARPRVIAFHVTSGQQLEDLGLNKYGLWEDPISLTLRFSEDVTDFAASDIVISGDVSGTITAWTGSGSTYIFELTITRGSNGAGDGFIVIEILEGAAQDVSGGNDSIAYSTESIDGDPVKIVFLPTLEIVVPEEPQNGPFDIRFVYNEPMTGFTQESVKDILSTPIGNVGGTLTLTDWQENATEYTATITPTVDGSVPIFQVLANQLPAVNSDGVGVIYTVESPRSVKVDRAPPTVTIASLPGIKNDTFEVDFTFNEDVTGFDVNDIELTGTGSARVDSLTQDPQDSLKYTATITPTTSGSVIIQVLADAVEDAATNLNTASESHTVSVSVDLVRPSVVISDVPATANAPFEVTITFSEDVTGFMADDIELTGPGSARVDSLTQDPQDSLKYTATITPTISGFVYIQVLADAVEDNATNLNTASERHIVSVSVDLVRPSVVISDVPTTSQNSDFDITITFSESVTGFRLSDISLTGTATAAATVSAFNGSGSGITYTASITPTGSGDLTIQVPANVAQGDVNNNNNTASRAHTVSVDLVHPSVVISDVPTTSQNSDFDITIMFSESVTGFQASDISLTGTATAAATVSAFSGSGTTYTASITPTGSGDLTIRVPANVAQDDVSNNNTASRAHTVSVDLVRPSVVISDVPTTSQNSDFDITITFSESVTGFQASDISLTGTATARVVLAGSGTTYTASITPIGSGDLTIRVPANVAQDDVSNNNTASREHTVSVDLVRPSVSITGVPTIPQNGAFDVTITFSESVTGFVAGDISLGGSAAATATLSGSGSSYTARIMPSAGANGSVTISVAANIAEDAAMNGNTASSGTETVEVDLTRPSVNITGVPTTSQNSDFDITITFSESVTGFQASEISLTGTATAAATVSAFSGSGTTYTASITPTGSGDLTIRVRANVAQDDVSNNNTASREHTVSVDLVRPSVSITGVPTTPQNGAFDVTITFDESVTGFVAGDIDLTGTASARVDSLTQEDPQDPLKYTATIRPTTSGSVIIQVLAGAVEDAATNLNTASESHTVEVDLVRPSVVISDVPTTSQNSAFDITITFSESVTGFQASGISLTGTATARVVLAGSGTTYTASITPIGSGDLTIRVRANVAQDDVNNNNTASREHIVSVDLVRPSVSITGVPTTPQNGAFDVTITFDESVTGFVAGDISLEGSATATVDSLTQDQNNSLKYTATITPTTSGSVIIQVLADAVEDAAGNGNTESDRYTVEVDVDRPTVTIASPSGPYNGTFEVDFTFNEVVTGFVLSDISLGGPARAIVFSLTPEDPQDPLKYTATIRPTTSGSVIIRVLADAVEDTAGNGNAESDRYTVEVDVDRPTVTIASPSGPYNDTFEVDFTFNEVVTGFVLSDISLGDPARATVDSLTQEDPQDPLKYTATITPTTSGSVIIQVLADAVEDTAGNGNTESDPYTVKVDVDRPMVTITSPSGPYNAPFDVTISFSEVVTGFGTSAVIVTGEATATAFSGSDGDDTYVVTITPNPNAGGDVTIEVPANVVTDAALNNNTASQVHTVRIDTIVPTVAISGLPTGEQKGPFDVTVTFPENVTGFVVDDDIELTGPATIALKSESDGDDTYEDTYVVTITPSPNAEGNVTLQVRANAVMDLAGNNNIASSVTSPVHIDTIVPTVESIVAPNGTQNGAFDAIITFNEVVTDFVLSDISLGVPARATVDSLTPEDPQDPLKYTATITPTTTGSVIIRVPAGAVEDTAGNGNAESDPYTVEVDVDRPTVTLSNLPMLPQTGEFAIRITFNEVVTGFVSSDISLGGTASATVVLDESGPSYTATITPTGGVEGDIIIQVPADVAHDIADNGNIASREYTVAVSAGWMPDKNLRDLVRDALGLPANVIFTKGELPELTVLGAAEVVPFSDDRRITDLTGLEDATDLTELYLNEHAISDLRPLATLIRLTKLSLNDNEIVNIWHEDSDDNPFADLTELSELSLENNLIADISALKLLTQLTKLSLGGNPIEDISALESLAELTELSLDRSRSPIDDISALVGLTRLTKLSLNENKIDDLMPLEGLTELTELSLNDNSIEDISFCTALTQLKILCLENNEISDVSPLAGLPNLELLKLSDNPIDDTVPLIGIARRIEADAPIASLISDEALAEVLRDIFDLDTDEHITYADMRSLTTFEAPDSDITDLSGLEHATELDTLDLRGNTIETLTPVKGLTKLTTLDLGVNGISTIDALAGLSELVELSLEENRITDITPLVGLVSLEVLKLADNPIADARPLAALTDVDIDIDVTMYLVAVPDEGVTAALQDALELEASDGIPSTLLEELTTLDAQDRQISDLTGLERATALTELDLRDNAISDVTPLAGLVKLETLRLTGNPIVDVSPLVDLTADIEADIVVPGVIADAALATAILDSLGLPASTRIKAVTLQNLKNLDVEVDQIETLTGLEHATNLTTLIINGGSITDLTPLQTLTQLTTLAINSGAITDLTPLQTLTQLTTLAINGGAITDLTPLQTLTQLTILELRDNTITDITPLSELTALTTLDLGGNNISSIEALQRLTALTTLNLSGNSVNSIDRLQALTRLTTLHLSGNSISSIEALKVLTRLTTLHLSGNSISSIEALKVLTRLTTLHLSGNSISSIEALKVLTRLTTLEFADNSLSSIDGLQVLTRLTTLNLSTNDLSDIQPLQGLTALRQLSLMSNNINDVLSLAGLVNLEFLRLAENPIVDTSPLFPLVTTHKLMDVDIEISQWAPWDVNQDGIVNVMDATLVTAAIGQTGGTIANSLTDVNDDGVVDRNDLLLVQEHLNTDAAGAPSTDTIVALLGLDTLKSLSRTSLEAEMNSLIAETDGSLKYQRAIKFLENFLLALRPNKTRLLANYPNPFNPETWIPYTLATVSAVQITIYDARGAVVRRLDLGHQREGYYTSRSRAAYWDGRNHVGERVASGIYFYELEADDISRLRKMVILK